MSHNPRIPASVGNTISCVQASGNDGLHPLTLYTHRGGGGGGGGGGGPTWWTVMRWAIMSSPQCLYATH